VNFYQLIFNSFYKFARSPNHPAGAGPCSPCTFRSGGLRYLQRMEENCIKNAPSSAQIIPKAASVDPFRPVGGYVKTRVKYCPELPVAHWRVTSGGRRGNRVSAAITAVRQGWDRAVRRPARISAHPPVNVPSPEKRRGSRKGIRSVLGAPSSSRRQRCGRQTQANGPSAVFGVHALISHGGNAWPPTDNIRPLFDPSQQRACIC